jgi:hypothetical protein
LVGAHVQYVLYIRYTSSYYWQPSVNSSHCGIPPFLFSLEVLNYFLKFITWYLNILYTSAFKHYRLIFTYILSIIFDILTVCRCAVWCIVLSGV